MGHMVYACLNKMDGYVVLQAYNSVSTDFGCTVQKMNSLDGYQFMLYTTKTSNACSNYLL